ncbi:MAG: M20 family peptidase, partial [Deinococcales bacterium]
QRLDAALHGLESVLPGARLEVAGAFARPPMEALPGTMALFEGLERIGRGLGLQLAAGRVGGASDGNFTAALGVATLDGLGPVGFADHTREEHILRSKLAERLALLAALLAELAGGETAERS